MIIHFEIENHVCHSLLEHFLSDFYISIADVSASSFRNCRTKWMSSRIPEWSATARICWGERGYINLYLFCVRSDYGLQPEVFNFSPDQNRFGNGLLYSYYDATKKVLFTKHGGKDRMFPIDKAAFEDVSDTVNSVK